MKDGRADAVSFSLWSARTSNRVLDYLALTKPRLNALVVATSAAGYYLGATGRLDFGTDGFRRLLAQRSSPGGAAVLNQVYERDTDALMRRTRLRPLPDGRVSPADARVFGWYWRLPVWRCWRLGQRFWQHCWRPRRWSCTWSFTRR